MLLLLLATIHGSQGQERPLPFDMPIGCHGIWRLISCTSRSHCSSSSIKQAAKTDVPTMHLVCIFLKMPDDTLEISFQCSKLHANPFDLHHELPHIIQVQVHVGMGPLINKAVKALKKLSKLHDPISSGRLTMDCRDIVRLGQHPQNQLVKRLEKPVLWALAVAA
mmetsp:Transcript_22889/g.63544  ORF Transcript_22889/g.63544 Transcript_22889/m.63544 type:complete len:165 (-) Transcript_22889:792-1286(-)